MKQIIWGIFILVFSANLATAQDTLKGRIYDRNNRAPLEGAVVKAVGSSQHSQSNEKGFFKLHVEQQPDSVEVSYLGYRNQAFQWPSNESFMNIGLKPDDIALNRVVVNALGQDEEVKEIAGGYSLLRQNDLNRDEQVNLANSMNQVPGVYYQNATYNTGRLTIRGIGSRAPYATTKVKAYFNEIPLTTAEGVTILHDIEPSVLSRAQVIKGPTSSLYGAGLGGTVLLEPAQGDFQTTSVSQEGMVGSFGLWKSSSTLAHSEDNTNIRGNYTRTHSDGFRENQTFDRHSATVAGSIHTGENSSLSMLASFIQMKGYIPSSLDSQTFHQNPKAAAENWANAEGYEDYDKALIGLSYETQILDNLESQTALFSNFRASDEPRPFDILNESRYSYGIRHLTTYSPKIFNLETSWTVGAELMNEYYHWQIFENLDGVTGPTINQNEQDRSYQNFFARGKIHFSDRTVLTTGLNYNRTTYELRDLHVPDSIQQPGSNYDAQDQSGSYAYEPVWSPRIGLSHELTEDRNMTVYASVSHGFSPPSVNATLNPEGRLNPNIKPEKGWSYEVGSRGHLLKRALNYDLTLYRIRVKDKLLNRRVGPDSYIGKNAGSTLHTGLEMSVGYHLPVDEIPWLNKVYPYAYYDLNEYRFEEFVEQGNDYSGNEMTGTIPRKLTAGVDFEIGPGFYGKVHYRFVDRMAVTDDNAIYTEPYHLLNSKAGFRQQWGKWQFKVYAGLNNITDEHYAAMIVPNAPSFGGPPRYYYPGQPRNYYVGMKMSMNL